MRQNLTRTAFVLLLLAPAVLASCGDLSNVAPDATISITGAAKDPTGRPLVGRPVLLATGVAGDDAALAFFSLGLACTSGICSGSSRSATTGEAGRYAFTLKGSDTQSTFGRAKYELVSVTAAPTGQQVTGAFASAGFEVQTEKVLLPSLALVDPGLSVRAQGSALVSSWSTQRPGPYTLSFEDGGTVPVWTAATADARVGLDGRVLEGKAGRAVLSATSTDAVEGSEVDLTWRSPGVAFASDAGTPDSRGSSCSYVAKGMSPSTTETCRLTDGDLSDVATPPPLCSEGPSPCPPATTATIKLPTPVSVDLIVIRGCTGACRVETSMDGRAFRDVGGVGTDNALLRLPGSPVRAVRVGLGDRGLREVSVWQPTRRPALKAVAADRLQDLRGPYGTADPDHRLRTVLTILAAALVLLAAVSIAFVLGRRGRR